MKTINDKEIAVQLGNEIDKRLHGDEIDVLAQYISMVYVGGSTKAMHDRVYNEILPKFTGNKNLTDEEKKVNVVKIAYLFGMDTQAPLWESVSNQYASLATNFSKNLLKEYGCNTPSEKALAQVIANAYVRILEYSNTLENCRNRTVNTNLIGYFSIISKELDRANRQFITALTTLKQLKAPSLEVNVTAKTAFIAQNQQLNVNQSNNENIEPK